MSRIITTEIFIKEAGLFHKFKYDYSRVIYTKAKTKIEIICRDHGSFWQTPNDHMSLPIGHGCPTCGGIIGNSKISKSARKRAGKKIRISNRKNGLYDRPSVLSRLVSGDKNVKDRLKKMRTTRMNRGSYLTEKERLFFKTYKLAVYRYTRESIRNNKLPNISKRGREKKGCYHLDHCFSIYDGFKNNIPPYIIGNICNLTMIPNVNNWIKNKKSSITINRLFEKYFPVVDAEDQFHQFRPILHQESIPKFV